MTFDPLAQPEEQTNTKISRKPRVYQSLGKVTEVISTLRRTCENMIEDYASAAISKHWDTAAAHLQH